MSPSVVWADHTLTCSDGVALQARIWQPSGKGCWPVLLMRQPYGRAIASTPTYAHPSWYAAQGFVVVVQDVRGSGGSGGSFGGFAQEARDSAETVLWARSLPASNGRVGTYGFSYQGLTQLLNHDPLQRPEALPDALAPAMCGVLEREHWSCSGGAHWWALGLAWGLQLAALQCRRRGDSQAWHAIHRCLTGHTWLEEGYELIARHDPGGMVFAWLQADPLDAAAWRQHGCDPQLLQRPLLLIGGWQDPHLEGILDLHQRCRAAGSSPQLHIGDWSHLHWHGGVDAIQLAFFRQHLQAIEPTQLTGSLLQCQTTANWFKPHEIQSPEQPLRWGLVSEGLAAIRSDAGRLQPSGLGNGQVALVHDPWRPAPLLAGHLLPGAGNSERCQLDQRSDVACFTTAPLAEPLLLLGRPRLCIAVMADQPGFDLVATLAVCGAGGSVRQLSMGVVRHRGTSCLTMAMREVVLQPLLATLQPSESLRLSLAASAWPALAVNPGDGSLPLGGSGPDHRVITLSFDLDRAELWLEPLPISADHAN